MLVQIEVTQKDIDQGTANACRECPLARAFKRAAPKAGLVSVYGPGVVMRLDQYSVNEDSWHARLPKEAREFVWAVDSRGEFAVPKPISFWFDIPERFLEVPA